jgi:ankyrin repeat protein
MKRRLVTPALIVLVALTQFACGNPREKARQKLGQMNIKYSEEEFIERAKAGDAVVVREFLTAGMSPNAVNPDGMTALAIAAGNGRLEIVEMLLAGGADVNRRERKYGVTPLIWASLGGNPKVSEALIAKGADPKQRDQKSGVDPLLAAAARGRAGVVKVLLEHGANPKTADKEGKTAVMWASKAGSTSTVKLLVDAGAIPVTQMPATGAPKNETPKQDAPKLQIP